jgi:alanyl-tRNA synthetase
LIPGSEGHGYVLRRIIRRALRHGHKLGQNGLFFHKLVKDLVKEMGQAYPELPEAQHQVERVLRQEEERFNETLENGMKILEVALGGGAKHLDGETAFTLYDTYGFPLDLTADICREREVTLDEAGFDAAMERQRATARAAGKFKMAANVEYHGEKTQFVGYDNLAHDGKILALYVDGVSVQKMNAGQHGIVVLDTTPFYAESGGQCGDSGLLSAHGVRFEVEDTQRIQPEVSGHHGTLTQGALSVGDTLSARVDFEKRAQTVRNHSATHLMHKALRQILGSHVAQKGSLVDAEKTRFDFSHNAPMTADEIRQVEELVNREILANQAAQAQVMAFDDAVKHGAMALFGEKYGDEVRVLNIGSSCELCGGTHVERTGDIGLFKIVSEGGIAAGIRRVEAVTGLNAMHVVQDLARRVNEAAAALRTTPDELIPRILQTQEQTRTLEKELSAVKAKMASSQGDELINQAVEIKGVKVLAATLEGADVASLRTTMDRMKDKLKTAAIVLASVSDGKVSLIAGVTADATGKVKAGELVNFVAQQVGGKGGGRPDMAQAGGTNPAGLTKALEGVADWVSSKLG